ncbi:uncharacterized protein LOC111714970 [Eurytemora carolleeae]|uniref:uncharacterized protein LOC111714970 n=1 Tax=Eurytemora carolleeae TaxID=1294199 RepID=UPI000C757E9D|nr:uncharacterized protein LOC111714970 [Eurytemora carolleeae]|eukprot:XP_023345966.1 uncharacterized protein LOC111714970 [Eurytemora affinis]
MLGVTGIVLSMKCTKSTISNCDFIALIVLNSIGSILSLVLIIISCVNVHEIPYEEEYYYFGELELMLSFYSILLVCGLLEFLFCVICASISCYTFPCLQPQDTVPGPEGMMSMHEHRNDENSMEKM